MSLALEETNKDRLSVALEDITLPTKEQLDTSVALEDKELTRKKTFDRALLSIRSKGCRNEAEADTETTIAIGVAAGPDPQDEISEARVERTMSS